MFVAHIRRQLSLRIHTPASSTRRSRRASSSPRRRALRDGDPFKYLEVGVKYLDVGAPTRRTNLAPSSTSKYEQGSGPIAKTGGRQRRVRAEWHPVRLSGHLVWHKALGFHVASPLMLCCVTPEYN